MAVSDVAYATPFNPKVSLRDLGVERAGALFAVDASDFDAAAKAIFELSEYIGHTHPILLEVREIARHDMEEHFDQEEAPNGQKWVELSPQYAIEKQSAGFDEHPFLVREGRLKDAALSQEAWSVNGDSLWFDTSVLPWSKGKNSIQYWPIHQFGSESMKGHERIPNHETGGFIAASTSADGRAGVPPRPFIGLSDKAGEEIITLIDGWLDVGMYDAQEIYHKYHRIGQLYKGNTIIGVSKGAGGKMQYRTTKGFGPMA